MITQKNLMVPDEGGLFWESRVSEALGVPRKVLARLRGAHLTAGEHFARIENNAVALTASGLAKIEGLLATGTETGSDGLLPGKPQKTACKPAICGIGPGDVPAGPPKRETMTVERLAMSPTLMLCVSKERPVLVAVRVRENVNFAPGMTFEAIESGDGVWQFRNRPDGDESTVGRLPRRKGVW